MAVKNITSKIDADKTIMEIEKILSKFGAKAILKEYSGENVICLSFYIESPTGPKIPFRLPMNIEKARYVITKAVNERKLPQRFKQEPYRTNQAMIVGWRIIKDWIHSQLSLFEIEFANPVEIFLPYAWNPITEKTLYQEIESNKFKNLSLEDKSNRSHYPDNTELSSADEISHCLR